MPTVESVRIGEGALGFQLAVAFGAATLGSRTATCGVRAAGLHATRDVVAGKEHLEVVGHERAHEAVRVANLVLRLVPLHHGKDRTW